jgi:hypothetical protein
MCVLHAHSHHAPEAGTARGGEGGRRGVGRGQIDDDDVTASRQMVGHRLDLHPAPTDASQRSKRALATVKKGRGQRSKRRWAW